MKKTLIVLLSALLALSFAAAGCTSSGEESGGRSGGGGDDDDDDNLPPPGDDASDDSADDATDDSGDDSADDATDDSGDDSSDDTDDDIADDSTDDTDDDADDDVIDDTSDDTSTDLLPPDDVKILDFENDWAAVGWDLDSVYEATGFKIYHSATGAAAAYTVLATVGKNERRFVHGGLSCDSTHYYRVTTLLDAEESILSDPVHISTNPCGQTWAKELLVDGFVWTTGQYIERFLNLDNSGNFFLHLPASPLIEITDLIDDFEPDVVRNVLAQTALSVAPYGNGEVFAAYRVTDFLTQTAGEKAGLYCWDSATDTVSDVDISGGAAAKGVSIALDLGGDPHIFASNDSRNGDLAHYWWDGDSFESEAIGSGELPHAAVTPDGTLHVLATALGQDLHYLKPPAGEWSTAPGSVHGPVAVNGDGHLVSVQSLGTDTTVGTYDGAWTTETIAGMYGNVTVATDPDGAPAVAALTQTLSGWTAKLATQTTDGYSVETAAQGSYSRTPLTVPYAIDLAFEAGGVPHIAFEVTQTPGMFGTAIHHAYVTTGKAWAGERVFAQTLPGFQMDAEAAGAELFLAYYNYGQSQMRLLSYDSVGEAWTDDLVENGMDSAVQLTLPSPTYPLVAYLLNRDTVRVAWLPIDDGYTGWNYYNAYVSTGQILPNFGFLYVASSGLFYFSIIENISATARPKLLSGDLESLLTAENAGTGTTEGSKAAIAYDGTKIHVAYSEDSFVGALAHAVKSGITWTEYEIAPATLLTMFDIDANTTTDPKVTAAYVDATTVNVTRFTGTGWTGQALLPDYPVTDPGLNPVAIANIPDHRTACFHQNVATSDLATYDVHHFGGMYAQFDGPSGAVPSCVVTHDSAGLAHLFYLDAGKGDLVHFYQVP